MLRPGFLPHSFEDVLDFSFGSLEGVLVVLQHLVKQQKSVVIALQSHCLDSVVCLLAELLALHELEESLSRQDHHFLHLLGCQLGRQHRQIKLHLEQGIADLNRCVNCTHRNIIKL